MLRRICTPMDFDNRTRIIWSWAHTHDWIIRSDAHIESQIFELYKEHKRTFFHQIKDLFKGKCRLCNHIDIKYDIRMQSEEKFFEPVDVAIDGKENYLKLQSNENSNFIYNNLNTLYSTYISTNNDDFFYKLIEDIGILTYMLTNATRYSDYILAIINFAKLRSSNSLTNTLLNGTIKESLVDYFKEVFGSFELQSSEDYFVEIREYLTKYDEIKNSAIYKKLYKFLMYALSMSLFSKIGLNFDAFGYSLLEKEAIKKKYYAGPDFIYCLLDTLTFLAERGEQCLKLGSMQPIFHSSRTYEEWIEKTVEIKRNANFLCNPEAMGFNRFSFIRDLKKAIETGTTIHNFATKPKSTDRLIVARILNELKLIEGTELTKSAAQKPREAPFSLCVASNSSTGKSTFSNILYHQFGKVTGLDTSPAFKYTRNANDDFWSGFNSTQWCTVLDDIAFLNPNAAAGCDKSMTEMLQVVNNVPFVPAQAALEDKGRTPFLCKLVIATTNTDHLNAQSYFSCPLAVQRRLPFVIGITPKPEFTKDRNFLDPSKIPYTEKGHYPDLWIIKVRRVIPHKENPKLATLVEVDTFDNIYKFTNWYSKEIIKFQDSQDKSTECEDNMSSVTICPDCYVPFHSCICEDDPNLQSMENISNTIETIENTYVDSLLNTESYYDTFFIYFNMFLIYLYFSSVFCVIRILYLDGYITRYIQRNTFNLKTTKFFLKKLGKKIHTKIGICKLTSSFAAILISGAGLYKLCKIALQHFTPSVSVQNAQSDEGKTPIITSTEKQNPWYKDTYVTTPFDTSNTITSTLSGNFQDFVNKIGNNCVYATMTYSRNGGTPSRNFKMVCLQGTQYITNNHSFPTDISNIVLTIIIEDPQKGINNNLTMNIFEHDITRFVEQDLCILNLTALPPKKSIIKFFPKQNFSGRFNGIYLQRLSDGSLRKTIVNSLNKVDNYPYKPLNRTIDTWMGKVTEPTVIGECGSLLIGQTPTGYAILGIHSAGAHNNVWSTQIHSKILDTMLKTLSTVNCGIEPKLNSLEYKRPLTTLHHKSVFRYIEEGSATVHGSFTGFRPKNSSKVIETPMIEHMLDDKYIIKHGPPVMSGWAPWRIAALEMVNPVVKIDTFVLDKCVSAFTRDIISKLDKDELNLIHILDDNTTVNGAAGVTYIDKINRNTSMGSPWKKCKKFFLTPYPTSDAPDGVKFVPEVYDRMQNIIDTYKESERARPLFCAHLKDEAVSFKKIMEQKTRVFTAAPVDWSLVVRKYLLSVVRVVQRNRFIFEAAPGTVAQSPEWAAIRTFITTFGNDRMIAGDYSKFDKRMPPCIILAAFKIIRNLCKEAGYTTDQLKVIDGIAADTSYPLVDFNGDLIQFYGSNPSGHPLTVIINSLANSLYMRYCYYQLNPDKEVISFQDNVKLMTYGDDNCMGVSKKIFWFTHTSIANCLAKVDIKYTMADKDAISVPYIHIDQISFLKRTWRWDNDVKGYLCPLEEDSINKMLTMWVPSKTISPEFQGVQVMTTATQEYFYYGKMIFEERRSFFLDVIRKMKWEPYVSESDFPTWDELYKRFWA